MKKICFITLFILNFNIIFSYYSIKLNKTDIPFSAKYEYELNRTNETLNDSTQIDNDSIYPYIKVENESYILTNNIKKSELYTASIYLGSNKQHFRLIISTVDDFSTISSSLCSSCNVSNKYNSLLSLTSVKLNQSEIISNFDYIYKSQFYQDLLLLSTETLKNNNTDKKDITLSKLNFKVVEDDSSGFLNSNIYDGILGLDFNKIDFLNSSFIRQLYNEKYISKPSFSIIITSEDINRLYLGDILENEYIKNEFKYGGIKGECSIANGQEKWICPIKRIYYKKSSFFYENYTLKIDTKENKLIIPMNFYEYILLGKRTVIRKNKKIGPRSRTIYDRECQKAPDGTFLCRCKTKEEFGYIEFKFNGTLSININKYVHFDEFGTYKCKVDISLTEKNEWVVGLKGLKDTILSFNMEDKKIKFMKFEKNDGFQYMYLLGIFIIIFIIWVIIKF